MRIQIDKTMTISQIMIHLDSIRHIEKRMIEIEEMDKKGLNLDQQGELLDEYNMLWEKANNLRK